MRYLIICLLINSYTNLCYAGIEQELLQVQYDECSIRITHDATPDSKTGTIIFRSFRNDKGIHYPCDINESITSVSLDKAFQNYLTSLDLKPVTSIMIGRLIHFPWARNYLNKNQIPELIHTDFNKIIIDSPVIVPFVKALQKTDYSTRNVSCEKILYNENDFVIDALCWLIVEKQ